MPALARPPPRPARREPSTAVAFRAFWPRSSRLSPDCFLVAGSMPAAAATRHLCTPRRSCLMRQRGKRRGVIVRDRPLTGAWGMTALIFLFMFINFADKAVLGLAAQPLMAELKLSPEQFGLIGSAVLFPFALSAGRLSFANRR